MAMEPSPKLSKHGARLLPAQLRTFWEILKARFATQPEEELARTEERYIREREANRNG